jgi:uncharacterized protein (TIGR02246 family)
MLRTPQEFMSHFSQCVSQRALDALMELYEPDAIFIPAPEVMHRGLPEIRAALAQMLALSPVMETRVVGVHEAEDIALVFVEWSLRGTAPDGSVVTQGGRSADVLRRQPDGAWRVLIDHP